VTSTVFNRHSSVAVDPAGHPIASWSAQEFVNGQLDIDFRILFRYGNSNNTWSQWWFKWNKTPGVHSFCPSLTYYNKGGIQNYGVDIVHHTLDQSTGDQTIRLKKYEYGNTWSDYQLSPTGAWANTTLENFSSGVPKNMWTDQSASPYTVTLNQQYLPRLLAEGEAVATGRSIVVQHTLSGSFVAYELDNLRILLDDDSEELLSFRAHDFRDPIEFTLANAWDYLGTDEVELPQNVRMLMYDKSVLTNLPVDTTGRTMPMLFGSRQFRFEMVDPDKGTTLASLDTNAAPGSVAVDISTLAGQRVILKSQVVLPGISEQDVTIGAGDIISLVEGPERGQQSPASKSPAQSGLTQNYPNPFNPMTSIHYSLREPGQVNLTVYDILGREVIVLVDGLKERGSYTVEFDASKLSSGVYFYRLKTEHFTNVKKMIVTK
jgi:hypothetical protein